MVLSLRLFVLALLTVVVSAVIIVSAVKHSTEESHPAAAQTVSETDVTFSPTLTPELPHTSAPSVRDLNCDFQVNTLDVLWLLYHLTELPAEGCSFIPRWDTYCDFHVDTKDVLRLLQELAGVVHQVLSCDR